MEKIQLFALLTKHRRMLASAIIASLLLIMIAISVPKQSHVILVAKHVIQAGQQINKSNVELVKTNLTWTESVTSFESLSQQVAAVAIQKGEPITQAVLKPVENFDESNPSAVSITLPLTISGSSLRMGDRVNIYGTDGQGESSLVAANALILAIEQNSSQGGLQSNGQGKIDVAIDKQFAMTIAPYSGSGQFIFVKLPSSL